MKTEEIVKQLKSERSEKNIAGMARFGIGGKNLLGISIPYLRQMAKEIKKSDLDVHKLAGELWQTEIHEARLLAGFIDDYKKITPKQMDIWANDFDSWDLCDQVCSNLFDKTEFAFSKCLDWSKKENEFEKRAGFALMAAVAVHRRDIDDKKLTEFFPVIIRECTDNRNFVRKAVNWALRQLGKRSDNLKKEAIKTANEILKLNNKTANWVVGDALREFAKKEKK
jgi:3-methyladenine DNA glycosylase AlkD